MGRRASSAASHGHPLLLQINDRQSKESTKIRIKRISAVIA
jgi:hypothetical protein